MRFPRLKWRLKVPSVLDDDKWTDMFQALLKYGRDKRGTYNVRKTFKVVERLERVEEDDQGGSGGGGGGRGGGEGGGEGGGNRSNGGNGTFEEVGENGGMGCDELCGEGEVLHIGLWLQVQRESRERLTLHPDKEAILQVPIAMAIIFFLPFCDGECIAPPLRCRCCHRLAATDLT